MRTSKWALVAYLAIIVFGILTAVPNVLTPAQQERFGSYLPAKPVTLGLDLKGGSHLVLEVDSTALAKARMDVLLNDVRGILRTSGERASGARLNGNTLVITPSDQAAFDTSWCLRMNQSPRVMRSSGGALRARLPLPAWASTQSPMDFCTGASSEASVP